MLTKERSTKLHVMRAFFVSQVPYASSPSTIQVCSALSMWIWAVSMDEGSAIITAIIVMNAEMCAGGFYADMRMLPWELGWVRFLSLCNYSCGSVLHHIRHSAVR